MKRALHSYWCCYLMPRMRRLASLTSCICRGWTPSYLVFPRPWREIWPGCGSLEWSGRLCCSSLTIFARLSCLLSSRCLQRSAPSHMTHYRWQLPCSGFPCVRYGHCWPSTWRGAKPSSQVGRGPSHRGMGSCSWHSVYHYDLQQWGSSYCRVRNSSYGQSVQQAASRWP